MATKLFVFCLLVARGACFTQVVFFDAFRDVDVGVDGRNASVCQALLGAVGDRKSLKKWAKLMLDATSKIQPGILDGNLQELGAFDECIAISERDDEFGTVKGKYCLGDLHVELKDLPVLFDDIFATNGSYRSKRDVTDETLDMKWAICVPDVCSADEVNGILGGVKFPVRFNEGFCQSEATQTVLTVYDKLAIAFFSTIAATMLLSTIYDVSLAYRQKRPLHPICIAFSMYTNGKKLFEVKPNPKRLSCVEGLRTISIMWVVYGHTFLFRTLSPTTNFADAITWYNETSSMHILGATISVDTFFVLGGLVLVYAFLSMELSSSCFNVPYYYFHRYIRLTPVLAAVLLFHVTLLDNLISGPLKPIAYPYFVDNCQEYWWSTLLYIQNYVNGYQLCIGVSWYICLDFQLIILSPLLLIPMKRFAKFTLGFTALLTCVSVALAFHAAWTYKLNPMRSSDETYTTKYYTALYTRAAPWLIGVILGYFVYQVKNVYVNFKINKALVVFLWGASLAVLATCVFGGHDLITEKSDLTLTSFYTSFVRPSWAIALSWVIFACVSGYGGPIDSFLSMSIFQILGRLTYCIYLTHFTIIGALEFSTRVATRFTSFGMMFDFWKYFMLIVGISILWSLAFESPVIAIEKCFKGGGKKAKEDGVIGNSVKVAPKV